MHPRQPRRKTYDCDAQLWKLHYLRAEQAAVEEVEFIARSISEEVSRREELAETKDLLSDKHDEAAFSEHKGALDAVDLSVVTDEHDTVSSLHTFFCHASEAIVDAS
jgi:hypothetical protein